MHGLLHATAISLSELATLEEEKALRVRKMSLKYDAIANRLMRYELLCYLTNEHEMRYRNCLIDPILFSR